MGMFKLQPDPTFKAKVAIPVAGAVPSLVEFTFKHRGRSELEEFMKNGIGELRDGELIKSMATGWELTDPFDDASLAVLVEGHIGAPRAIYETYIDELVKGREKN